MKDGENIAKRLAQEALITCDNTQHHIGCQCRRQEATIRELVEAAKNAVAVFNTDGRYNGEQAAVARLKTAIEKATKEGRG
jgi:hypothetical protein